MNAVATAVKEADLETLDAVTVALVGMTRKEETTTEESDVVKNMAKEKAPVLAICSLNQK